MSSWNVTEFMSGSVSAEQPSQSSPSERAVYVVPCVTMEKLYMDSDFIYFVQTQAYTMQSGKTSLISFW